MLILLVVVRNSYVPIMFAVDVDVNVEHYLENSAWLLWFPAANSAGFLISWVWIVLLLAVQ